MYPGGCQAFNISLRQKLNDSQLCCLAKHIRNVLYTHLRINTLAGCVKQTELSGETTITIKCDYVEASVDLRFYVVN